MTNSNTKFEPKVTDTQQQIRMHRRRLSAIDRRRDPQSWFDATVSLAGALLERSRETSRRKTENQEQAIAFYQSLLRSRLATPSAQARWNDIRWGLGSAYNERVQGSKANNVEQCIRHYQEMIRSRRRDGRFYERKKARAFLLLSVSQVYLFERRRGRRGANIERAIHYSQTALKHTGGKGILWACCHATLGSCYRVRTKGTREQNFTAWVYHDEEALSKFTREDYPAMWAATHFELGKAYRVRKDARVVRHLNYCLEVYTLEDRAEDWADTHWELALAHSSPRIAQAFDLPRALHHCQQALTYFSQTGDAHPRAAIQFWMGYIIYGIWERQPEPKDPDLVERAINLFNLALKTVSRRIDPGVWALIQRRSGLAYVYREQGDETANLRIALKRFQNASRVYSPNTHAWELEMIAWIREQLSR